MKDFEKLKDKNYVRAFGLMKPEERECFEKIGPKHCLIYMNDWDGNLIGGFCNGCTYAIKSDYQLEPEFVDLEIVLEKGFLGVIMTVSPSILSLPFNFTHFHCLPSLEAFDDFWYEDSPGCKFFGIKETAIARCRFEGKKVFARFRI